jgi:hypothetical protein
MRWDRQPPFGTPLNRASPQAGGLVYAWSAHQGRGAAAWRDVVRNNTATLAGNAVFGINRGWGFALACDGSGDYADTASLTVPVPFSFAVWVRNDASDSNIRGVFRIDGASTLALYRWNNGRWAFYTGGSLEGDFAQAGVWEHVVCTYDGTTKCLFLNGRETGFGAGGAAATLSASTGTLRIGGDGFGQMLNGAVGDFRIYNRALTPLQIAHLYAPATRFDLWQPPARRRFAAAVEAAPPAEGARSLALLGVGS